MGRIYCRRNFGSSFVNQKSREKYEIIDEKIKDWSEKRKKISNEEILNYTNKIIEEENPFADIEDVIDAIDHIVNLVGINHVGFGSDYDGLGNSLPKKLKDVSTYPNIIFELLKRGYNEKEIEKVCYRNFFRVWNDVLKYRSN